MNCYLKTCTYKKIIKKKYLKLCKFKYFKFKARPKYPLHLLQVQEI